MRDIVCFFVLRVMTIPKNEMEYKIIKRIRHIRAPFCNHDMSDRMWKRRLKSLVKCFK